MVLCTLAQCAKPRHPFAQGPLLLPGSNLQARSGGFAQHNSSDVYEPSIILKCRPITRTQRKNIGQWNTSQT